MKRIGILPVILGMLFIAACTTPAPVDEQAALQAPVVDSSIESQPTSVPPAAVTQPPAAPTESASVNAPETFEVVVFSNVQDDQKTDVLLRNTQSGEQSLFLKLDQVYREHYHAGEYNHQNLYIVKRIGDVNSPDGDWMDELWRYDSQGNGEKLFAGKGLDFRAAPDGQLIALQFADGFNLKIVFLRPPSEVVKEYDLKQLDETGTYYPSPETWNAQSNQFWGALHAGPRVFSFFRMDTASWAVTRFDVSALPINTLAECALNGNTGGLVYSDYPAIFDAATHQEFVDSQKPVNLYLFDLNSQASQTISTSQAKDFEPRWLDDRTVEFNNPNGDERITFTLP